MDRLTRREFVLGALTTTTAVLTLDGCAEDEGRPSDDEVLATSESGTEESTSEESTTEESTTEESTSEESTTEESITEESTTEESTTEESTTEESTSEESTDTTEESTETGDPVCPDGASGTILRNHGHSMIVPAADVQAGVQKVYAIQGASGHNHTVTLTASDFSQLQVGNVVMKTSSFLAAHDHEVLVSCLL
jgi:DNA mismatch repair ATPase MutL